MTTEHDCCQKKKRRRWRKPDRPGHEFSVPTPIGDRDQCQEMRGPTPSPSSQHSPSKAKAMAKARGLARERAKAMTTAFEGAQALRCPQQGLGKQPVGTLLEALDRNANNSPTCPFLGPRQHIPEWELLGSDKVLLQVLKKGINAPLHAVPQPKAATKYHNENSLMTNICEYLAAGVIGPLSEAEEARTRFWIPFGHSEEKRKTATK